MRRPLKVFRSDIKDFLRSILLSLIAIWVFILFLGATSFHKNGYANGMEFVGLLSLPFLFYVVAYLFLRLMKALFPVMVFDNGIRCYNYYGAYHFVEWEAMNRAYVESIGRFQYLYVEADDLKSPLAIPFFLEEMDTFVDLIKNQDTKGVLAEQYENYPFLRTNK